MFRDPKNVIPRLEKERENFYKKVDTSRRIDLEFAVPSPSQPDEPLTEEEIAQIDEFWGKYKYAYPNIDYKSFETFKNRSGKFSVLHCPGAIRTQYFRKHFNDANYFYAFQNKGFFPFLYPDVRQPKTVLRRVNGVYLDENFNPLTLEEAIDLCNEYVHTNGDVLVKPSGAASSGGHGIIFLKKENTTPEFVRNIFTKEMPVGVLVVQEKLCQSEFMNQLNPSCVNTIRITTFLWKGVVRPLGALIRVGNSSSEVDAFYNGGTIVGIDMETGKLNDWALSFDHTRVKSLPSGVDLSSGQITVPNFDKVKEAVVKSHYRNPYIKMISWDIALADDDLPTFIECNYAGMLQLHEAVNGPLFGDLMEELLDTYLYDLFFNQFATTEFMCKEYADHVTISEYIRRKVDVEVVIPDTLRGKPVTLVERDTFKGYVMKKVTASEKIQKASPRAFTKLKDEGTIIVTSE